MVMKKLTFSVVALSLAAGTAAPHTVGQIKQAQAAFATIHAGNALVKAASANKFDSSDFNEAAKVSGQFASILARAAESEANIATVGRIADAIVSECGFDKGAKGYSAAMAKQVMFAAISAVAAEAAHLGAAIAVGKVASGDNNRILRRALRAGAFSAVQATLHLMEQKVREKATWFGVDGTAWSELKKHGVLAAAPSTLGEVCSTWAKVAASRLMVNCFQEALGEIILQGASDAPVVAWIEDLKAKLGVAIGSKPVARVEIAA